MFSRNLYRSIAHYKINPVIKLLIASDFIFWSALQLFSPIIAVFIINTISGGDIIHVGIAASISLIVKSLCEIPIGVYIDSTKSEKDDLFMAGFGVFLMALMYIFFTFATEIWHVYAIQAVIGFSFACSYPSWLSLFTRHIDKGKEGFEWSMYDFWIGLGTAGTATLGAFVAERFGFNVLFYSISILVFASFIMLLMVRAKVLSSKQ
ncbi:MAG: MFS transporter [Candidatus Magasanikbacteria bacterium]